VSKNRFFLSVFAVVAMTCMISESANAQLLKGRLLGKRRANKCCCEAPAPAAPAPCCGGTAAPVMSAPVMSAPSVISSPAIMAPAPTSSCCGGGIGYAPVMNTAPMASTPMMSVPMATGIVTTAPFIEGGVVSGETIISSDVVVQESPSDNTATAPLEETVTSSVDPIEPPAEAPVEEN